MTNEKMQETQVPDDRSEHASPHPRPESPVSDFFYMREKEASIILCTNGLWDFSTTDRES